MSPPPEGHDRVASRDRLDAESSGKKGARPRARQRQVKVARSARALLERAPNAHTQGALDGISKNVVPDTEVVASPADVGAAQPSVMRPPNRGTSTMYSRFMFSKRKDPSHGHAPVPTA